MAAVARYVWDESDWPILRVDAPPQPADDRSFQELLDWYGSVLLRGQPFVLTFELGLGAPLTVERRDQLRRHTSEHAPLIAKHQSGLAIVAKSAYQRAMARALFWIVKPPCPTEVFENWDAARAWATERVRGAEPASAVAR